MEKVIHSTTNNQASNNHIPDNIPFSKEAERTILGALMISGDHRHFDLVQAKGLQAKHFFDRARGEIFEAIFDLYKQGKEISIIFVADRLRERGSLSWVGDEVYLNRLLDDLSSLRVWDFFEQQIDLILKLARDRHTYAILTGEAPNQGSSVDFESVPDSNDASTWPDPDPLPDPLLPVPSLPVNLLPAALRGWVYDIADRLQVPLEFPAVPAIIAAGAVIGNRVKIQPKRHDDWTVVPNLWGAIIGRPGAMKSPAIEQALKPLRRLMAKAAQEYEDAKKIWAFDKEKREVMTAAIKKKMLDAAKKGQDIERFREDLMAEEASEPTERRYLVNDTTVEKYGELLNQNPRGLLIFRDELTGWFRSLDDYRRANDRAFYLEAWNGDGSYVYDRIGRGTLKIDNTTTSILGGIQPKPLSQYLQGALGYGEGDDGLMQRFQMSVYPDLPSTFKEVDRWPDTKAKEAVFELYQQLDTLPPDQIVRFDDPAQELFSAWLFELRNEICRGDVDNPALISHFAKYANLFPKLALIFHLCEGRFTSPVSLESAELAAAWCEFLRAHALRIYGLGLGPHQSARTLAAKLISGVLPPAGYDYFTERQVYLKGWGDGLKDSRIAKRAIEFLVELKWLHETAIEKVGRPTTHYVVNPKIKAKGGRSNA